MADTGSWKDSETDKLLDEVRKRYRAAKDHWREWLDDAQECYKFYAGDQWSEDDRQYLREQQRPEVTFNRSKPLIDAVLGHEANNRNEVRYIPRTRADAEIDEVLTNVSKYFLDECDGETHQSDAFRDMLITGVGWTCTRLDDEQNPDYDLKVERISPREMLVDPSSTEPNFADARYIMRRKRMDKEEVKSIWPQWDGEQFDVEWSGDDIDKDFQPSPAESYTGIGSDSKSVVKDILVLEYQWKEIEPYHVIEIPSPPSPDGRPMPPQIEEMSVAGFRARRDKIKKSGVKTTQKRRITWKRAFIIGSQVVQEDEVSPKGFTYHAMTGFRDDDQGYWFGLMRSLMDLQRWSNKWLSQMMHIINTNAVSGLNIEESAADDIGSIESKHAQPGRVLVFRDGALQRNAVQPVVPMSFPTNVEKLLEYANQSFSDVSGVNAELLGMADREQPGVLEWQRKQSAVSLLAPLFDSLRRYRKMFGRTWLYFIQTYVSDGRVARISMDDKQQYVTVTPDVVGDPEVARYDVVIDQQASAPNQKEATWSVLTSLFPAIKDAMDPDTMLLFLEYSPLPTSLVSELKQMRDQKAQQGPPPDPEMMKAQAQIQATQMKTQADQEAKKQDMAFKREQLQLELQLEQQKAQIEMEIAKVKAGHQVQLEQMKLEHQGTMMQQQQAMQSQQMQQDHQLKMSLGQEQLGFERQKHEAGMHMEKQKSDQQLQLKKQEMQPVQANNDSIIKVLQSLQSSQAEQTKMLADAISRPKKLVRGPDGRAAGIQ